VAQNLNLMASGMNLGCLNLGGFFDSELADLLDLNIEQEVLLYGVENGTPSGNNRTEIRRPTE
jgi:hypothetical protein